MLERLGGWHSIFQRLNSWAKSCTWRRIIEVLGDDSDLEHLLIASSVIQAHRRPTWAGVTGAIRRSDARAGD